MSSSLAQLRMEYKLDLIMLSLQANGLLLMPGDVPQLEGMERDICPVCGDKLKFQLDVLNEKYIRSCGCKPPRTIVSGISDVFKNPPESTTTSKPSKDEAVDDSPLRPAHPPSAVPKGGPTPSR